MKADKIAVCIAAAFLIGATPSPHEPMILDPFFEFAAPDGCLPSPQLLEFIDHLAIRDGEFAVKKGEIRVPAQYRRAFGEVTLSGNTESGYVASVPVHGRWLGLDVVAISQSFPRGGDPGFLEIEFANAAGHVATALNAHGFPVIANETTTIERDQEVFALSFWVKSTEAPVGHARFGCGFS